jgi:chemotaxis protein methyltransferase CheR
MGGRYGPRKVFGLERIGKMGSNSTAQLTGDLNYMVFRRKVKALIGIDLDDYKSEQMTRRLNTIMVRCGAKNLADYARMLEHDSKRLKEFADYLTINVSEFFRDPDRFTYLQTMVLPGLLSFRNRLNIWSAACSIGAEPYTLAMILEELSPNMNHRILATDIDERILLRAQNGNDYRQQDVHNVPPRLLKKYFTQSGDFFAVADSIRRRPTFKKHNLLNDSFEEDFDLIVCRNVVIYFTQEAKDKLFARLTRALRPGGILFLGATEIIQTPSQIGLESIRPSFYRRAR